MAALTTERTHPRQHLQCTLDYKTILLLLSVAAVVAFVYWSRVDRPNLALRQVLHQQIIEGTALSPYRYRILVPFVGEALRRALATAFTADVAFLLAYAVCDLAAVGLVLVALLVWLRQWFSADRALVGVLFAAATMPIALQDHYYQPWSLPEAALLAASLIAIRQSLYWVLFGLVALASLNRETAVFIPLAFLATSVETGNLPERTRSNLKVIFLFAGLVFVWLAIVGSLRYLRGSAPPVQTIAGLLKANLAGENLARAALNWCLFLGAFWVFAILGFRSAPPFLRRLALIIPVYIVTIALWGVWYEVRLLMPLYPVLIPLGLSFIYADSVSDATRELS
jgi:hypothetical protein